MKKIFAIICVLLVCAMAFAALDFKEVDTKYNREEDYQGIYNTLQQMLTKASDNSEKAEVLWRLSRVCVSLGDDLPDKDTDGKFALYEEGEQYAIQSIEAKPSALGYLWKCSNIGRWGQTKGVLNSLAKSKPMMADLKTMTDTYNYLESSEAWYVLSVLYSSLPGMFGGDSNAAISYARIAVETIPSDTLYLGTYMQLAETLYARNWDAKKRTTEINKMKKSWDKENSSNYEKYKYYEGKAGSDATPIWTNTKLSAMTDRQEAKVVLQYAKAMYDSRSFHTAGDDEKYKELCDLLNSWK